MKTINKTTIEKLRPCGKGLERFEAWAGDRDVTAIEGLQNHPKDEWYDHDVSWMIQSYRDDEFWKPAIEWAIEIKNARLCYFFILYIGLSPRRVKTESKKMSKLIELEKVVKESDDEIAKFGYNTTSALIVYRNGWMKPFEDDIEVTRESDAL